MSEAQWLGFLCDGTVDCHQLQLDEGVFKAGVTGEHVNVSWHSKAAWQPGGTKVAMASMFKSVNLKLSAQVHRRINYLICSTTVLMFSFCHLKAMTSSKYANQRITCCDVVLNKIRLEKKSLFKFRFCSFYLPLSNYHWSVVIT